MPVDRSLVAEDSLAGDSLVAGDVVREEELTDVELEDELIDLGSESARDDQRARDELVERATAGLIRLEGRRRWRIVLRRLLQVTLAVAVLAGICFYGAPFIPKAQVDHYWQELKSKLPVLEEPRDKGDRGER